MTVAELRGILVNLPEDANYLPVLVNGQELEPAAELDRGSESRPSGAPLRPAALHLNVQA